MRRDPKTTPDPDEVPCCPNREPPETVYNSADQLHVSESIDICDSVQSTGFSEEDDFLTSLSADTPETDMTDIFESVFGDSSSSLGLLTPIEHETPEHVSLPSIDEVNRDVTMTTPETYPTQTQGGVNERDIFLAEPFLGLTDDLDNASFYDFSTASLPSVDCIIPPSHVPGLEMVDNGYRSLPPEGVWSGHDFQIPQPTEAARMTIVIDEAKPETLTEVMKVLMESRARVEFRRG